MLEDFQALQKLGAGWKPLWVIKFHSSSENGEGQGRAEQMKLTRIRSVQFKVIDQNLVLPLCEFPRIPRSPKKQLGNQRRVNRQMQKLHKGGEMLKLCSLQNVEIQ